MIRDNIVKVYYQWRYLNGKLYRVRCTKGKKPLDTVIFEKPMPNVVYICL